MRVPPSPVIIWVGVFPGSELSATAAHDASQVLLALLKDYGLSDVGIQYRESSYFRSVAPQLIKCDYWRNPTAEVIRPLTPALGLQISTRERLDAGGTMALYLAEGGERNRLLGLSSRHVLFGPGEANVDYTAPDAPRPDQHPKNVVLLGTKAYDNLLASIKIKIADHSRNISFDRRSIVDSVSAEAWPNPRAVEEATRRRAEYQRKIEEAELAIEKLAELLRHVQTTKEWRHPDRRVLGRVLRSPALQRGVGQHRFTEDWAIFEVDRAKLGEGFEGNQIDLGA